MTVYVDDYARRKGILVFSHMLADTEEELHQMAQAIGVAKKWWQSPERHSGSHYDICQQMKTRAIQLGAQPVTVRQAAAMNARRRVTGELGAPDTAVEWLRAYVANQRKERV